MKYFRVTITQDDTTYILCMDDKFHPMPRKDYWCTLDRSFAEYTAMLLGGEIDENEVDA